MENKTEAVEKKHHKKDKKDFTSQLRKNPWILATLVLGVVTLILLVGNFGATGKVISQEKAQETFLSFLETQGADLSEIEVTNIETESTLYAIHFNYQGEEYPIPYYLTQDGSYVGMMSEVSPEESSITASATEETTEVPQTETPEVGLYIWSYCPYGVTALTPFAKVASLLDGFANFKVYLYYAGHGDFEVQQNKIQACMQKIEPENYWEYAERFVEEIYPTCSGDVECDLTESTALIESFGIDPDVILDCVETQGEALLEADYNSAGENGVSGSPSLVINGVKVTSARTADAYKTAVCSAFTTTPEECTIELDSTAATTTGNC